MRYWWVNHGRTAAEEVAGRFLWAPEAGRPRNITQADNVRRAGPGDLVLSYAARLVGAVGQVADHAFPARRPEGFGRAIRLRGDQGWRLPVAWTPVEPPVRPADFHADLAPLLPARHSPLNALGRGEQRAYLCEIGAPAFERVLRDAAVDLAPLADAATAAPDLAREAEDAAIEAALLADPGLTATEKQQLATARRGQGVFRERVRALEPACRITGVANPWLLIAGHIKPWRLCDTAAERLDGANGLMLTPDLDRLFDRGFITFEADGTVVVSPRLDPEVLERLDLASLPGRRTPPLTPAQAAYMAWHRARVFMS
ncbi:MAG: HNH endonuclease [Pseudomonadota bacterium]